MADCTCNKTVIVDGVDVVSADPNCSVHRPEAQPIPTANELPVMHEVVIDMLRERLDFGIRKYGVGLQPLNGRNSAHDALEEVLDLAVYLAQVRHEMDVMRRMIRYGLAVLKHPLTKAYCLEYDGISEFGGPCWTCQGQKEQCGLAQLIEQMEQIAKAPDAT